MSAGTTTPTRSQLVWEWVGRISSALGIWSVIEAWLPGVLRLVLIGLACLIGLVWAISIIAKGSAYRRLAVPFAIILFLALSFVAFALFIKLTCEYPDTLGVRQQSSSENCELRQGVSANPTGACTITFTADDDLAMVSFVLTGTDRIRAERLRLISVPPSGMDVRPENSADPMSIILRIEGPRKSKSITVNLESSLKPGAATGPMQVEVTRHIYTKTLLWRITQCIYILFP